MQAGKESKIFTQNPCMLGKASTSAFVLLFLVTSNSALSLLLTCLEYICSTIFVDCKFLHA